MDPIKLDFDNLFSRAETRDGSSEEPCKGLFFRAELGNYVSYNGDYVYRERMRPLRRMSCKGCMQCDYLHEYLKESLFGVGSNIQKFEDGGLYQLCATNTYTDCETGYVDDWDLEFIPVKPKK